MVNENKLLYQIVPHPYIEHATFLKRSNTREILKVFVKKIIKQLNYVKILIEDSIGMLAFLVIYLKTC